jgi:hypothetical protein
MSIQLLPYHVFCFFVDFFRMRFSIDDLDRKRIVILQFLIESLLIR